MSGATRRYLIQRLLIGAVAGASWTVLSARATAALIRVPVPGLLQAGGLTDVNGTLFFSQYDAEHGTELWKSDGTAAGTVLVKDINPGTAWSIVQEETFASWGGKVFFAADDGGHGLELWRSDGTPDGTVMVKDIVPGAASTSPLCPAAGGSALYFTADDGVRGSELWKTDGTEAGTVLVKDINPGPLGSSVCARSSSAVAGGVLYFTADDGVHGRELWRTDGTDAGTMLVKDVNPGSASAAPFSFVPWQGAVFFAAIHASYGMELWKTDGTEAGTVMVRDIWPGPGSSGPGSLTARPDALFFFATDQTMYPNLWRTDGTSDGTTKVSATARRSTGQTTTALLRGMLLFPGLDSVHGVELWRSDGTGPGTWLVRDIRPGGDSSPWWLTAAGDRLYFSADDGVVGRELWRSDGTAEGTRLVADLNPTGASSPAHMTVSGRRLFFTGNAGTEYGLWALDLYLPPTEFYALTPCRLVDTRGPAGPSGGPALGAGAIRTFPMTGAPCGVPPTAVAVSVNITAVDAMAPGYLALFPGDFGPPLASNLNFSAGKTRGNNAVVPLATDGTGTVGVKNGSAGSVHFVLDVNGYFQ